MPGKTGVFRVLTALGITAALALSGCGMETDEPLGERVSGWALDTSFDPNTLFDCFEENGRTLISAHRGGAYPGLPENSIEAMLAMLSEAPVLVEVDVASSADGVLFLMHDDRLERTTTGAGVAADKTWAEISALSLEDPTGRRTEFSPPRFDEALSALKNRTLMQIDFKRSARFEDVIDEVKRQGAERSVIYIAYSMAAAAKLHRLHPEAMISLSLDSESEISRAAAAGAPPNRLLGFTGTTDPRPRLFNALNGRDVEVIFGTLGGARSIDRRLERTGNDGFYAELAEKGVDIIATDRPLEAFDALEKAGRAPVAGECGVSQL